MLCADVERRFAAVGVAARPPHAYEWCLDLPLLNDACCACMRGADSSCVACQHLWHHSCPGGSTATGTTVHCFHELAVAQAPWRQPEARTALPGLHGSMRVHAVHVRAAHALSTGHAHTELLRLCLVALVTSSQEHVFSFLWRAHFSNSQPGGGAPPAAGSLQLRSYCTVAAAGPAGGACTAPPAGCARR